MKDIGYTQGMSMEKEDKNKKQICAIYTRVSTEEQAKGSDFTSLDNQREYAENYIKSQESLGWEICPEKYDDPGFTGGNMERPGLRKLLSDAKRRKFNVIVIYKIDRLTRSLNDFGKLWDIFEKYDISFVSVTQKFDTTTSMGRLMLHVLLSFSQFEREINSERTRDKMLASAKRGKWMCGNPPLGFDLDHENKKLVVNKEEIKQIKYIFETYLREKSYLKTANIINDKDYRMKSWITLDKKHRGGNKFTKNRVKDHLINPIYIGKIRYKGEIYKGEHSAVISEEIFKRVQERIKANSVTNSSPYKNRCYNFLLGGLIRCTYCNSRMIPGPAHSKGRVYLYYKCTKVDKNDRNACDIRRVPAKEIENMIIGRIKYLSTSPQIIENIVKKASFKTTSELPSLIEEMNAKIKKKADLNTDIENLKKYIKEKLKEDKNIDFMVEEVNKLLKQHDEITNEIEILKMKHEELNNRAISIELVRNTFQGFNKVFDKLGYNEKRDLLRLLIREIRYGGSKSDIEIDFFHLPKMPSILQDGDVCTLGAEKGG